MVVTVSDSQIVGDNVSQLFETSLNGPVSMAVTLENQGVNTIEYQFNEFNGINWSSLDVPGTPTNNALTSGQKVLVLVTSSYARVNLTGSASGGAVLAFSAVRAQTRPSGAAIA